jgi:hypothetical protein
MQAPGGTRAGITTRPPPARLGATGSRGFALPGSALLCSVVHIHPRPDSEVQLASSSRSQVTVRGSVSLRTASAAVCLTWERSSVNEDLGIVRRGVAVARGVAKRSSSMTRRRR